MRLNRNACEYIYWDLDAAPIGSTFEVTFDDETWFPMERVDNTVKLIVAGSEAETVPVDTPVLEPGAYRVQLRTIVGDETLVREAGDLAVI